MRRAGQWEWGDTEYITITYNKLCKNQNQVYIHAIIVGGVSSVVSNQGRCAVHLHPFTKDGKTEKKTKKRVEGPRVLVGNVEVCSKDGLLFVFMIGAVFVGYMTHTHTYKKGVESGLHDA